MSEPALPTSKGHPAAGGGGTHLVQVLAVGAVAQEAQRARATGPGPVREAAALGSGEAGVGQAAVCAEEAGQSQQLPAGSAVMKPHARPG